MRFVGGLIVGLLIVVGLFVYFSVADPGEPETGAAPDDGRTSAVEAPSAGSENEEVAAAATSPEIAPSDATAPAPVPQPTAGINPSGPATSQPTAPIESPSFSAPDQLDQPTGGGQIASLPAVGSLDPSSPAPLPTVPGSGDSSDIGDVAALDEGAGALAPDPQPGAASDLDGTETVAVEDAAASLEVVDEGTDPSTLLDGPALSVNAVAFDDAGDGPMIAVVLNDAGASPLTLETLLSLSVPLTLGIVPRSEDDLTLAAEAKIADYEVLAQLPVGEAAGGSGIVPGMSDVEASAAAERAMRDLWMSVGASKLPTSAASAEEDAVRGVLTTLKRSGYAFVDADAGSDSPAERTAEALEVAYAGVSQTIDPEASADEIIEMLNAVVDAAGPNGTAIVSGPASRAMLEALFRWQQEATQAARLAPVSAVIRAQQGS